MRGAPRANRELGLLTEAAQTWQPERLRLRPLRLLISLVITALALGVTAALLPGVDIVATGGALLIA